MLSQKIGEVAPAGGPSAYQRQEQQTGLTDAGLGSNRADPEAKKDSVWAHALLVLLPVAIYLALVAALGAWIMDDAGISYAYARNVASGYGFVSQPGRPPVEGFSNFLWVVVLATLFVFRVFQPVLTVKALSALLVLLSLLVLQRLVRREVGGWAPALLTGVLIGGAAPIVIWTASGLENALTMLLAVALYDRFVRTSRGWELQAGLMTALLAMNHPENALYLAAGLLVCAGPLVARRESLPEATRHAASYAGAFAALFLPFMAFRLLVFGLLFPHPYYAKRLYPNFSSQLFALLGDPPGLARKFLDLARGMVGPVGLLALIVTAGVAVYLAARGCLGRAFGAAVAIQAVSIASYLWMDQDWMGEYRFATVATTFSLLSFVLGGFSLARALGSDRARRWIAVGYLVAATLAFASYIPRVVRFAQNPPTAFADVARQYAFKFNVYADILGLPSASVFLPDIGATLLYSNLTVYDAAGLCEPDVIRTLKKGTVYWLDRHPEFYDYVFETIKPTFINTHDFFTQITAFERDPRFARDYVAVNAYPDEYVQRTYGSQLHSGDYVRKDVLRGAVDLERLQAGYQGAGHSDPPVDQWRDWVASRLGKANSVTVDELMQAGLKARHVENNPNRAAVLFSRVLQEDPRHYGATYQLAAALDAAGRQDEARPVWGRAYRAALALKDPRMVSSARERLGDGYQPSVDDSMRAGLAALYTLHDPPRAIEQFRIVLEQNPKHYGATFQLASALEAAGRPDDARPMWEKVVEMASGYGDRQTADAARARLQQPDAGARR